MRYYQLILTTLLLIAVYLGIFILLHDRSSDFYEDNQKIDRSNGLRGVLVNGSNSIVVRNFNENKNDHEGLILSSSNLVNSFSMTFKYKFDRFKLFSENSKKRDRINLVLGMATDLEPANFAIFAKSFREFNDDAAVIIFMNYPIVTKNVHIAKVNNITLIEFKLNEVLPLHLQKYHPSTLRWILKYHLLFNEKFSFLSTINRVILIDVRDSMFQSDPFKVLDISDNILHVVGEETRLPIGDCTWNRGWILDCFGEEMLNALSVKPIICSGVTLGSVNVIADYLHQMNSILSGKSFGHFPFCERNGVDQGVHNVIVYANLLLTPVKVDYEQDLLVSHMQTSLNSNALEFGDVVLNLFLNSPISIVHQYDRWYKVQMHAATKYIDWINVTSSSDVWNDSIWCNKNYDFIPNRDMFFGQCDAGSYRAFTIATCCERCFNYKKIMNVTCTGFAHSDGVCYFKKCENDYIVDIYGKYQRLKEFVKAGVQNEEYNELRFKLLFSEQKINDFGALSVVDSGMLRLDATTR